MEKIRVRVGPNFDPWRTPGHDEVSLAPGESLRDIDIGPEMVLIAAGTGWMGSGGTKGLPTELPRLEVSVPAPFLVGKYPVTFEEWDAAQRSPRWKKHTWKSPYPLDDGGHGRGRRPVTNVDWFDAAAYAQWLAAETTQPYRLLSEAEWEYCCRGGTSTAYSVGATISTTQAHFSSIEMGDAQHSTDVGKFPANPFGLHDMHGNVWEWCQDTWRASHDHRVRGRFADCSPYVDGDVPARVSRGGSWYDLATRLRSACRMPVQDDMRSDKQGFRVARSL